MKKIYIILASIFSTILLIAGTYAYMYITASNSVVTGKNYKHNMSLSMTSLHTATSLIPINDSYIPNVIDNSTPCVDANGYEVCSLNKVTITNSESDNNSIQCYIETVSSTYTTANLYAQLFTYNSSSSTYSPISNSVSISSTSSTTHNFITYSGSTNLSLSISTNSSNTYYLATWLHESNTLMEQGKDYQGKFVCISSGGSKITAKFSGS